MGMQRIMVAFVVLLAGCGRQFQGVDPTGIGYADLPPDVIEAAIVANGGDPSAPELAAVLREARSTEAATNQEWIVAVNRRLRDALERTGNVGKLHVKTKNPGARVKAQPLLDKAPDSIRESDLLTNESTLTLAFGRWRVWTERPDVGRTSDEEVVEVLDGEKTREIVERRR